MGEVRIAAETYVGNHVSIKGDMNLVYIGEFAKIEDRVSIMTLNRTPGSMEIAKVDIGDNVLIQSGCSIISSTIKDGAIIGYNSVICEGSSIG